MAPKTESLGQRIRRERDAAGLTQRQLADMAGVVTPHISKIENDKDGPSARRCCGLPRHSRPTPTSCFCSLGGCRST